jgi:hypothetical protein
MVNGQWSMVNPENATIKDKFRNNFSAYFDITKKCTIITSFYIPGLPNGFRPHSPIPLNSQLIPFKQPF